MASKASEGLCFAWTGEFDLLKNFVKDNLKLNGIWSQPGGDKKVFASENCKVIWRKNKNILSADGKRAQNVLQEMCKQMCMCDEFGLEFSQAYNRLMFTTPLKTSNLISQLILRQFKHYRVRFCS